jgi:hypothetical protein
MWPYRKLSYLKITQLGTQGNLISYTFQFSWYKTFSHEFLKHYSFAILILISNPLGLCFCCCVRSKIIHYWLRDVLRLKFCTTMPVSIDTGIGSYLQMYHCRVLSFCDNNCHFCHKSGFFILMLVSWLPLNKES